jgi:hypothetical protein
LQKVKLIIYLKIIKLIIMNTKKIWEAPKLVSELIDDTNGGITTAPSEGANSHS